MARTPITVTTPKGPYPTLPVTANSLDMVMTAADTVNKNSAVWGSNTRLLLVAYNTDAGAHTVTLTSAADPQNRTGDITAYSLGAGEVMMFVFMRNGWLQPSDSSIHFEADHATVKFIVTAI